MSPLEIVAVLALVGFAVYKQSQRRLVTGSSKLAITYAVVGLAVGGFAWPEGIWAWVMLAVGLALSAAVGFARGRLTPMWTEDGPDGPRVVSQGTALTIGLFLGLVVVEVRLGIFAYFTGIGDGGGFGEVLFMIAIMVALQAQIMWRRAQVLLGARPGSRSPPEAHTHQPSLVARPPVPAGGRRLCGAGGAARRAVSATRVADAESPNCRSTRCSALICRDNECSARDRASADAVRRSASGVALVRRGPGWPAPPHRSRGSPAG